MEHGNWGLGRVGLGQAAEGRASGSLWGLCRLLGNSKAFLEHLLPQLQHEIGILSVGQLLEDILYVQV